MRDALAALSGSTVGIDPVDLPFALLLDCAAVPSRVALRRALGPDDANAVIRGTLLTLIDLCDGRLDGDAAFFARRLTFDGNAAAVVMLRNALDGADIDLRRELAAKIAALPPPLRRPAEKTALLFGKLANFKRRQEEREPGWN